MQPWSIGLVAVLAIGVVVWLKLRKSNSEEIYAIVLMIETPRMLRGDIVAPAISTATGKEFSEDRLTEEKPCYFRAVVEGFEITIASTPGPYGSAKSFERDRRIHEQALLAKGAILLDIWKAPEGASKADGLPLLGKIAAELMDGETRLIYLWPHQRVNVGDEELKDRFARGEAVDAMLSANFDPVTNITNNRKMDAAVDEARNRWPEFASAFSKRTGAEGESFIAKFRFPVPNDPESGEHMWIEVESIDDDNVSGILLNDPVEISGLRNGDKVTRSLSELSDWLYATESGSEGGFVERILRGGSK